MVRGEQTAKPDFVAIYPGKCGKLAMCRMEVQGQWFRMQMLMCESTRYGHLCAHDGSSLPTEIAARGCGLEVAHYELGLAELSKVGLIHRDSKNVIFDPEMVEFAKAWSVLISDAKSIHLRRAGDCERQVVSRDKANTVVPNSFSCSKEFRKKQKTSWPEGFSPTAKLQNYACSHGVLAHEVITMWEHFENHHKAKGSRFLDWERAWYTWVQNSRRLGAPNGQRETSETNRRTRETRAVSDAVIRKLRERAERAGT